MPVVFTTTEYGAPEIGSAWNLLGCANAIWCILQDDFAPLLIGEDAIDKKYCYNIINSF
jgi:hypothetical protein